MSRSSPVLSAGLKQQKKGDLFVQCQFLHGSLNMHRAYLEQLITVHVWGVGTDTNGLTGGGVGCQVNNSLCSGGINHWRVTGKNFTFGKRITDVCSLFFLKEYTKTIVKWFADFIAWMVKSVTCQNVLGRNIKMDNISRVFVKLNALFQKTSNVLNVTDRFCPYFVLFCLSAARYYLIFLS